jgi:hypothetical protein
MASIKLRGDTSGELVIEAPAVAGTNTLTLPAASGNILTDAAALPAIDGSALTGIPSLGVGQTWQNLTASRSAGVTYTNTTGNPIQVSARANIGQITLTIDSIPVELQTDGNLNNSTKVTGTVPNGDTYSVTLSGGSLSYWAELR